MLTEPVKPQPAGAPVKTRITVCWTESVRAARVQQSPRDLRASKSVQPKDRSGAAVVVDERAGCRQALQPSGGTGAVQRVCHGRNVSLLSSAKPGSRQRERGTDNEADGEGSVHDLHPTGESPTHRSGGWPQRGLRLRDRSRVIPLVWPCQRTLRSALRGPGLRRPAGSAGAGDPDLDTASPIPLTDRVFGSETSGRRSCTPSCRPGAGSSALPPTRKIGSPRSRRRRRLAGGAGSRAHGQGTPGKVRATPVGGRQGPRRGGQPGA